MRAGAVAKLRKRVADQQARVRKAQRDKAAEQGLSVGAILHAIARKAVFVEQACRSNELAAALGKHGLWSAPMHEAEVFVVQFPGQAGVFMSAASAIRGAYQLSPKVLLSGGSVALKMKPVFHLAKTLYISPACAAGRAPFCAFV